MISGAERDQTDVTLMCEETKTRNKPNKTQNHLQLLELLFAVVNTYFTF